MSLDIQNGDVVKVTGNNGKMYFCSNETATTFATKFTEFTAGTATSVAWSGVTGKPDLATQAELDVVDAKFGNYLPLAGGALTGDLHVKNLYANYHKIILGRGDAADVTFAGGS